MLYRTESNRNGRETENGARLYYLWLFQFLFSAKQSRGVEATESVARVEFL